jgi:G6PDH family F420-dependent oxidoreductase
MTEFGLFLSSEEHGPRVLLEQAQAAERAGFTSVFISDHYHPWIDRQGESPFVWSVIGAIAASTELKVTTGVTCPTVRIHPAILAQAAATSQLLLDGRFRFGVGSGEALNEHITGEHWPAAAVRHEMLEEAIEVMRGLWTGRLYSHHGRYYTVENARIYSCPASPPPVLVSGFGEKSIEVAARIGEGFVTTKPLVDHVRSYREQGGRGPAVGAMKVCFGDDERSSARLAYELWPTEALKGQLSQELPMPRHFEQVAEVVTEEMVAAIVPHGPDPEPYLKAIGEYIEAGFDELFVTQIGTDVEGFLRFFNEELRPKLH